MLGEGVPQSIPTGTAQLIVEKPQAKRCMGVCRGVKAVSQSLVISGQAALSTRCV